MDLVVSEAISDIRDAIFQGGQCPPFIDQHFMKLKKSVLEKHESVNKECFLERNRLNRANDGFQQKINHVRQGIEELEIFSEIGIGQFISAKNWLRMSTEKFKQEYDKGKMENRTEFGKAQLMKAMGNVKYDVSRFFKTVREELDLKIQKCTFSVVDSKLLRHLIVQLVEAVHVLNSKCDLSYQTNLDACFQDINRDVAKMELLVDELLAHISKLQQDQKDKLIQELNFDPYSEQFGYLLERESNTAAKTKIQVEKIINQFKKDKRKNNKHLELSDIEPYLVEIDNAWESLHEEELQRDRESLDRLKEVVRIELNLSNEAQIKLQEQLAEAKESISNLENKHHQSGPGDQFVQELLRKVEMAVEETEIKNKKIDELQTKQQRDINELMKTKNDLKNRLEKSEANECQLENKLDLKSIELLEEKRRLESILAESQNSKQRLEVSLKKSENDRATLQASLDELKRTYGATNVVMKENNELKDQLKKSVANESRMKKELDSKSVESAQLSQLWENNTSLTENLAESKNVVQRLAVRLEKSENDREMFEAVIAQLNQNIEYLKSQLEECKAEIVRLTSALKKSVKELNLLNEGSTRTSNTLAPKLSRSIPQVRSRSQVRDHTSENWCSSQVNEMMAEMEKDQNDFFTRSFPRL